MFSVWDKVQSNKNTTKTVAEWKKVFKQHWTEGSPFYDGWLFGWTGAMLEQRDFPGRPHRHRGRLPWKPQNLGRGDPPLCNHGIHTQQPRQEVFTKKRNYRNVSIYVTEEKLLVPVTKSSWTVSTGFWTWFLLTTSKYVLSTGIWTPLVTHSLHLIVHVFELMLRFLKHAAKV